MGAAAVMHTRSQMPLARAFSASLRATAARSYATGEQTLLQRMEEIIPQEQKREQAIGGARGVKCMIWETSLLDAEEGIRFRGYTIPELQSLLPDYTGGCSDKYEPLPEGLLW